MTEKAGRRGIVTPENEGESRKLKALWVEYRSAGGLSQLEFGDEFGIGTQSAVTNMLNGKMAISLKAAKGFAKGLGVEIKQFSPRLARVIDEHATAAWPLGEVVTPAVWEELPEKVRNKIRSDAEYIVREHHQKSGKSSSSQGGAGRRAA
jgi:transcriptional regulator with XRE-family HTH domain